ncbi:MAG TPA: preprotein translocase subunit YajC [Methylomirabilota bacterium]|jgi:preprotein translocase subunit YajC|nr:preprotein translocase subunit YajC [Methylomirabilota bacterium]
MVDYAYAAAQSPSGSGGGSMMVQIAFFAAIFAIFYFLLIRPQQKQKRERESMLSAVKPGDRVVMSSGLHGTVVKLSDHSVTLKVADQVRLEFDRSAIGRIVPASGEGSAST